MKSKNIFLKIILISSQLFIVVILLAGCAGSPPPLTYPKGGKIPVNSKVIIQQLKSGNYYATN